MFLLKKILESFLLPPGLFILLMLAASFRFFIKKNHSAGAFCFLMAALLYASSLSPVSDYLLGHLESKYKIPARIKGDVIVLLGGGIFDNVPDLTGTGAPSEDMYARIFTAIRLQKRLGVPVIISGGRVFRDRKPEAPVIKRFLTDLGVPADEIIIDDKSRDTLENASYTEALLKKYDFKDPLLVTSAYHMARSVRSFEMAGVKVTPVPADFKTWKRKYGIDGYLPTAYNLERVAKAGHEYLGLLYLKLTSHIPRRFAIFN